MGSMISEGGTDMSRKSALALFGGVFDPVHQGHVDIAFSALAHPGIEKVLWIPCPVIPHHKSPPLAPAEARLEMTRIVCKDVPGFVVEDIEFQRNGPAFTVDTVKSLSDLYPDTLLLWIVGADNASSISQWKSAEELWNHAIPVIAPRPGSSPTSSPQDSEKHYLCREDFPYISEDRWKLFREWTLPAVSQDVSSSQIRHLLANPGESKNPTLSKGLGVPDPVLQYLLQGGWYQQSGSSEGST
ncbi:nicotinate (nicotinamide) nucleotide adenylyltransferase [Planctomycetota bacterium]|nr:nicotinate (nicotinamide) nucleotide adenylyltransferase [Planctomycetota bacterium]